MLSDAPEQVLEGHEHGIRVLPPEDPGDVGRDTQHSPLLLDLCWLAVVGLGGLHEEVAADRQEQPLGMDPLDDTRRAL